MAELAPTGGAAAYPALATTVAADALPPEIDDGRHDSLLHAAVSPGDIAAILSAAPAPADALRAVGRLGRVPLHSAAAAGLADVVLALTAAGAPPNPHDDDQATPLHLAARGDHVAAIAALLGAKARVDARFHPRFTTHVMAGAPRRSVRWQRLAPKASARRRPRTSLDARLWHELPRLIPLKLSTRSWRSGLSTLGGT